MTAGRVGCWQLSPTGHTLPLEDRDYPEWHKGRVDYGVWLITADLAPVRERIAQVRAHLAPLLVPDAVPPRRQPHITVFVCGFIAPAMVHGDDFTPAMLAAQRAALAAAAPSGFTLQIGGIDSFDSAVFLRVDDPQGGLAALRRALGQGMREIRQSAYVPHLTVGLYRAAFDTRMVADCLAAWQPQAPIALRVECIELARYQARVLGGPLETLEAHLLQNQ